MCGSKRKLISVLSLCCALSDVIVSFVRSRHHIKVTPSLLTLHVAFFSHPCCPLQSPAKTQLPGTYDVSTTLWTSALQHDHLLQSKIMWNQHDLISSHFNYEPDSFTAFYYNHFALSYLPGNNTKLWHLDTLSGVCSRRAATLKIGSLCECVFRCCCHYVWSFLPG